MKVQGLALARDVRPSLTEGLVAALKTGSFVFLGCDGVMSLRV